MNKIFSLLLTLGAGLFMLLGGIFPFLTKDNRKFLDFSIGLAFSLMIGLGVFEILKEAFSLLFIRHKVSVAILIGFVFITLGILILKLLDIYIPHHDHDHKHDHEHKHNLYHVGLISSIAFIIHNLIEGMAIYNVSLSSIKTAALMCIGVGLHNIPLGMIVSSTIYSSTKNVKKTLFINFICSITMFIGGILMLLFGSLSKTFEAILLLITFGMIIYITLFELLQQLIESQNKKLSIIGLILGVVILVVTLSI